MKNDIDWKGIAHCWETLVKENKELRQIITEQDYMRRALKKHTKFVDTYGGISDKPEPNCDIVIMVYDEDPNIEKIKEWLEAKE